MAKININNTEKTIEAIYQVSSKFDDPVVLLAPPGFGDDDNHNMDSPLMRTMARCFHSLNFSVLRFDYSEPERELEDGSLALGWLRRRNPAAKALWVGGVSLGSWVSLQLLMRRPDISGFVVASLPVHNQDFSFLSPCSSSGLIVEGENDEKIGQFSYQEFVSRIRAPKGVKIEHKVVPNADHLLQGQEAQCGEIITQYAKGIVGKL